MLSVPPEVACSQRLTAEEKLVLSSLYTYLQSEWDCVNWDIIAKAVALDVERLREVMDVLSCKDLLEYDYAGRNFAIYRPRWLTSEALFYAADTVEPLEDIEGLDYEWEYFRLPGGHLEADEVTRSLKQTARELTVNHSTL